MEEKTGQLRYNFEKGTTLNVSYRKKALQSLYDAVKRHEKDLLDAMYSDLGKSASEAYMCEVGLVLSEIRFLIAHVSQWSAPVRKLAPLANFPAFQKIYKDPYGVVLIMSPWNYPVLLTLGPLAGAIAAGNCVCVKPSAYSPSTSAVISRMIAEIFDPGLVACVTGGRLENQSLLDQKFDYIFFTGGVSVGRMVMEKAARHLTPVTLELGGKSPTIVDEHCDLPLAARRIAFGKFLNCGQTCIAPDYVLCHRNVHDRFVQLLIDEIKRQYGENPLQNSNYGRIVNRKHFDRLCGLIDSRKVVYGGATEQESLRIAPTVIDNVELLDAIMREEIFGPLLPVVVVKDMDEAFAFVKDRPHPLALYLFTDDSRTKRRFLRGLRFGGGCVNDTIMHIATHNLPFGGVGNSGMGSYHGKKSFDTFSREKAVVSKPGFLDLPLRYQPYSQWKDRIVRLFLR